MQIIASIFKKPLDLEKVREMIIAGADVLRVKFAHMEWGEIIEVVKKIKILIDEMKTDTKIMVDIPEQKIRLGHLAFEKNKVGSGEQFIIRPSKSSYNIDDYIPVNLHRLDLYFKPGDKVSLGDGETAFVVKEVIEQDKVLVEFLNDGEVDEYRGLMSPNLSDCMDHCSIAVSSVALFHDVRPDYVALSFVNSADYVNKIKEEIKQIYKGEWNPKILAKIESPEGLKNLAEIMDASDGVVFARVDLGLTTDYTEIILEQKRVCKMGLEKGKPVIIATQILTSCIDNAIPHRSELADLTNLILDGASGILLSQETSLNEHPGKVIEIARKIIQKVEEYNKKN